MQRFLFCLICLMGCLFQVTASTIIVKTGEGGNFFSPAYVVINPGDTILWNWKAGHHNTSSFTFPSGAAGWYGNLTSTDSEFYYIPSVSGLYNYTCTHHSGMDGSFFVSGCSFPSKPSITGTWDKSPCAGAASILLRTIPQAGVSYQWLKGGTLLAGMSSDSIRISSSGSYTLIVNRCGMDSASNPFFVSNFPLPLPSFTFTSSGLHYFFTNTSPVTAGLIFKWRFGDGTSENTAVNTDHIYTSHGKYKITLSVSDSSGICVDSVNSVINTKLSIPEEDVHSLPKVFPNPTDQLLNIWTQNLKSIQICEMSGKIIFEDKKPANKNTLDLKSLTKGSYLLSLFFSNGERLFRQIIITQ